MQVKVGHNLIALSETKGEYTINSPSTSLFKKRSLLGKRLRNDKMAFEQSEESADNQGLSVHSKIGQKLDANLSEMV